MNYLKVSDVDEGIDLENIIPQASTRVISNLNMNSFGSPSWIGSFDILSIQETKIDKTFPNSQFHNSIPSYQLKSNRTEVEAILVHIQSNQQDFSLLCAYNLHP